MKRILRLLVGTALGALVVGSGAAGADAVAPQAFSLPRLVAVRAAAHPTYDRVVFEFTAPGPTSAALAWVTEVRADPSDLPVPVAGRAFLSVVFQGVDAHTTDGNPTVVTRVAWALPDVITTVKTGDFEGVVSYAIGLAAKTSVKASWLTAPNRFVLDVSTATLTTSSRPVWFVDERKIEANIDPPITAAWRPVLTGAPATGLMDRLWAGPTPSERERGLTFVASRSTGFTGLSISGLVARIRLVGGCNSGGSAVATVATQIMPTLKQFSTVDWVKIYDPAGRTETPTGRSDSIPECLEP